MVNKMSNLLRGNRYSLLAEVDENGERLSLGNKPQESPEVSEMNELREKIEGGETEDDETLGLTKRLSLVLSDLARDFKDGVFKVEADNDNTKGNEFNYRNGYEPVWDDKDDETQDERGESELRDNHAFTLDYSNIEDYPSLAPVLFDASILWEDKEGSLAPKDEGDLGLLETLNESLMTHFRSFEKFVNDSQSDIEDLQDPQDERNGTDRDGENEEEGRRDRDEDHRLRGESRLDDLLPVGHPDPAGSAPGGHGDSAERSRRCNPHKEVNLEGEEKRMLNLNLNLMLHDVKIMCETIVNDRVNLSDLEIWVKMAWGMIDASNVNTEISFRNESKWNDELGEAVEREPSGEDDEEEVSKKKEEIRAEIRKTLEYVVSRGEGEAWQDHFKEDAQKPPPWVVSCSRKQRAGKTESAGSIQKERSGGSLSQTDDGDGLKETFPGRLPQELRGVQIRQVLLRAMGMVSGHPISGDEVHDGDPPGQRHEGEAPVRVACPNLYLQRHLGRGGCVNKGGGGVSNDAKKTRTIGKVGFKAEFWDKKPLKLCDFIDFIDFKCKLSTRDNEEGSKGAEERNKPESTKEIEIFSDTFRHKKMVPKPSKCAACCMDFASVAELKSHNSEVHKKKLEVKKSLPAKLKLKEAAACKSLVKTPLPMRKKGVASPGSPTIMGDWLERKTKSNRVGELMAAGRRGTGPKMSATIPRSTSNPGPMGDEGEEILLRETRSSPSTRNELLNSSVNLLEGVTTGSEAEPTLNQGVQARRTLTMFPPGFKERIDTIDQRWDAAVGRTDSPAIKTTQGNMLDPEEEKSKERESEKEKKRDRDEEEMLGEEKRKDDRDTPPEVRLQENLAKMNLATGRNLAASLDEVARTEEAGGEVGKETMEVANMIATEEWELGAANMAANMEQGENNGVNVERQEAQVPSGNKIDFSTLTEEDINKLWEEGGAGNLLSPPNAEEQGNLIDELYSQIESASEESRATATKLQEVLCEKDQLWMVVGELEDKLTIANNTLARAKQDTAALSSKHVRQIEMVTQQVQTERERESAEVVKLRMEIKHFEAKLRRESNEVKAIKTQNNDAKIEITRLVGELRTEKLKCGEGAKMLARLESVARDAQAVKVDTEKKVTDLEHKLKQVQMNQPCKIRNCEGDCGTSNHHCGERRGRSFLRNDTAIPRFGSVPTVNNLATEANLTEEQMNDVIHMARPTGQFRRENVRGGSNRSWTNRGRSVDGRGRSVDGRGRSSGPKKPPRGYVVEKCRWFYNPNILYCPWGNDCWNSHSMQSAQASRGDQGWRNDRPPPQEDGWRNDRPSSHEAGLPSITPAYHPNHPLYNAQPAIPVPAAAAQTPASGNEQGQSRGAASVQINRPPTPPPRSHSYSSATRQEESVSLEEAARRRVQETLNQRRSDRAHVQAMEDPGWTNLIAAAEETIKKSLPQNMRKEDHDMI